MKTLSKDVLVGDVFVCSGQSNMEWALWNCDGAEEAVATSADPMMRLLTVPRRVSGESERDLDGKWTQCGPVSTPAFSAVAFFGGRALRRAYPDVPVGMIAAAWGGSRIEPWIGPAGLQAFPKPYEIRKRITETVRIAKRDPVEHEKRVRAVRDSFGAAFARWHGDLCRADGGEDAGYASADYR